MIITKIGSFLYEERFCALNGYRYCKGSIIEQDDKGRRYSAHGWNVELNDIMVIYDNYG